MSHVEIEVLNNGPYIVTGPIELKDAEGASFEVKKNTIALCRCGASVNKPFCDGTHSKLGFRAAETAVAHEA